MSSKKWNLKKKSNSVWGLIVRTCFCFVVVQCAWIFFRADSVNEVKLVVGKILSGFDMRSFCVEGSIMLSEFMPDYKWMKKGYVSIILLAIVWIGYLDFNKKYQNRDYLDIISNWGALQRWIIYYTMIILIMFSFVMTTNEYGQAGAFLYFQF